MMAMTTDIKQMTPIMFSTLDLSYSDKSLVNPDLALTAHNIQLMILSSLARF